MNIGWYFSDDLCPSDELVDRFADSKFGVDKWSSFAREIIQNSLDAQDNEAEPVRVIFELNKSLSIDDIPGGRETRNVLSKCMEAATNKQTKSSYKIGLDVLNKDKVYCLKISDTNTKGVKTGREEAWGAFVFDEGRSIKQRPGSAGSHGVGKKVPFIISSCNTVFYATKNKYKENGIEKSDCLVQGKTTLISWKNDEGQRKSNKGWFGLINEEETDSKNVILPVQGTELDELNPYFVRKEEFGTDVIIVGANMYNNEKEVKRYIISAVLENFFVAIMNNKLIVEVLGETINSNEFEKVFRKYYQSQNESKNTLTGCLQVYQGEPDKLEKIYDKDNKYVGEAKIYFMLGSEHNKKYYTIVRNHGMRIVDYRINKASQPYTAVVVIEGKELNCLLSSLENAAHDNFVTKDENMEIDKNAVYVLDRVCEVVSNYVIENTKIDDEEGQTIEGLSNIITIPGMISTVKKGKVNPKIKKNSISKKGKGKKSTNADAGQGGTGESDTEITKKKKKKPSEKGDEFKSVLYENFKIEPIFIKQNQDYILKFEVSDDIQNGEIKIFSINSEGKQDNTVSDFIERVYLDRGKCKIDGTKVTNVRIKKGELYAFKVKMKRDITYQLGAEVYRKEKNIYE